MEQSALGLRYRVQTLASRVSFELDAYRRRVPPPAERRPLTLPENLIALDSAQGTQLLRQADAIADYVPLSIHFVTQDTPTFCGPASMTMVLNALCIERPGSRMSGEHGLFDQDNVFTRETHHITPRTQIARHGTPLSTLGRFFEAHGVDVKTVYASSVTLDQFRDAAKQILDTPREYLVVNYNRSKIGQNTGGHISPVAAYNAASDMFLVLDVSRYKYPPFWVTARELYRAMNVKTGAGITHGYVTVRGKPN